MNGEIADAGTKEKVADIPAAQNQGEKWGITKFMIVLFLGKKMKNSQRWYRKNCQCLTSKNIQVNARGISRKFSVFAFQKSSAFPVHAKVVSLAFGESHTAREEQGSATMQQCKLGSIRSEVFYPTKRI